MKLLNNLLCYALMPWIIFTVLVELIQLMCFKNMRLRRQRFFKTWLELKVCFGKNIPQKNFHFFHFEFYVFLLLISFIPAIVWILFSKETQEEALQRKGEVKKLKESAI